MPFPNGLRVSVQDHDVYAVPRWDIEKPHATLGVPYLVISIRGKRDDEVKLAEDKHRQGCISYVFDDVERDQTDNGDTLNSIQQLQADSIWAYIEQWWNKVPAIVVHCEAGRSRSVGVAAAIVKAFGGDDTPFFQQRTPNMLCYRRVYNAAYEARKKRGPASEEEYHAS